MADTKTSTQQLKLIGAKNRVTYPSEFVAHVCGRFPGIYVEVKESVWPRPKKYGVGPFWSFLYGLHTFTSAPESDDWMRLDFVAESFQRDTHLDVAPILRIVGDANVYCVDSQGAFCRFDHETNTVEADDLDFWELFERELQELVERKHRKIDG